MAEVRFSKVSKVYAGDVHAVTDFDLTVRDREFVVLVGPSGCGKSTALRMVAGLEDISSGDLFVDGKRVNDLPPKNRDIAMVFQNYALYPHMNVYDNMAFGLKLRRFSKAEIDKRVREAAEILGLSDYLKRRPKALSGGQRQRVAVGRSIVRKPKVFLFDEPLSNLDAKMRVQMRKEICQLHQRIQATMIYVTHDQTEAMTMGDRIVVMKDGVIQQVDKPLEIYHRPSNVFVGGFIGSPEMNFFDCRFTDGALTFKGNTMPLTEQAADRIKTTGASDVWAGIRPEDMAVANGHGGTPVFDATVEITELLGAEVFVYAKTGGIPFIAKVRGTTNYSIGDSIQVTVDPDKVHIFDKETEAAL